MFLEPLIRRNPAFVETAIRLHQDGLLPPNSYVLDLDAIRANLEVILAEARRHGLTVFPMTKQLGCNPEVLRVCVEAGVGAFVAVETGRARIIHEAGYAIGHIGHLTQVPRREAPRIAAMGPSYWTVFDETKAREAAAARAALGGTQPLLARIVAPTDRFYPGHEGGFDAGGILRVADALDALPGGRCAGVTTFPALLFDEASGEVRPTPNLATIESAARSLRDSGRTDVQVNAPGTTASDVLAMLASAGATQVEPGHGLTGTTPLHAVRDLSEVPAALYLSEISHLHGGRAYCFGGGLYLDPVRGDYDVRAIVGRTFEEATADRIPAHLAAPNAIDYYGMLDPEPGRTVAPGDTVVYGFRIQAFVTRGLIAPVEGIRSGKPVVRGIWTSNGHPVAWP